MKYYQTKSQKHSSGDASWHSRSKDLRRLGKAILDPRRLSRAEERELQRLRLIEVGLLIPTSKKAEEKENDLYA